MSDSRYAPWLRRLHWAIFVMVACALLLIYARGWTPRGSALHADVQWAHMQFGIAILLIMLPRLLARARHRAAPPITPPSPRWQMLLAHLVHVVLYLLLFATPILGITMMVSKGHPWNFLGIPLPYVSHPDRAFVHSLEDVHGTVGNILMYLAGAHALIGLYHHFVQRDDTLMRMLPPRQDRS
jgi:cytochrome b561